MFKVYVCLIVYPLQSCRFCASVSVGPVMSQYLSQVLLPFRSYVNLMMVLSMWLTHYMFVNIQFMTLMFCSYLEHKVKSILALSWNWKVNFKLFNPEMDQN